MYRSYKISDNLYDDEINESRGSRKSRYDRNKYRMNPSDVEIDEDDNSFDIEDNPSPMPRMSKTEDFDIPDIPASGRGPSRGGDEMSFDDEPFKSMDFRRLSDEFEPNGDPVDDHEPDNDEDDFREMKKRDKDDKDDSDEGNEGTVGGIIKDLKDDIEKLAEMLWKKESKENEEVVEAIPFNCGGTRYIGAVLEDKVSEDVPVYSMSIKSCDGLKEEQLPDEQVALCDESEKKVKDILVHYITDSLHAIDIKPEMSVNEALAISYKKNKKYILNS